MLLLIAAGAYPVAAPAAGFGPISVPPERTAIVARVQGSAASTASIPLGAVVWEQAFDPAEHLPYAFDFSTLLDAGEEVVEILAIRMSATAAALGIVVDATEGYAPIIDEDGGLKAQLWFAVDEDDQDAVSFLAAGVLVPVTMRVRTDSVPPKRFERTNVLKVRQL